MRRMHPCFIILSILLMNDNKNCKEDLLFSQELKTSKSHVTSKCANVIDAVSQYFAKHGLMWHKLARFCTDGAPTMIGSCSGYSVDKNKK